MNINEEPHVDFSVKIYHTFWHIFIQGPFPPNNIFFVLDTTPKHNFNGKSSKICGVRSSKAGKGGLIIPGGWDNTQHLPHCIVHTRTHARTTLYAALPGTLHF